jgi:outer membrane protein assembly factor BamB
LLNRWITSGGWLTVTNKRVFFSRTGFDAATGNPPWECPLASVAGIEAVDRDLTVPAGGTRKRLGIQTSAGVEVFVVNGLEGKLLELRKLLSSRTSIAED